MFTKICLWFWSIVSALACTVHIVALYRNGGADYGPVWLNWIVTCCLMIFVFATYRLAIGKQPATKDGVKKRSSIT